MPTLDNGIYYIVSAFDPAVCIDVPAEEAGNLRGDVAKQRSNGLVFQQWSVEATDPDRSMYKIAWYGNPSDVLTDPATLPDPPEATTLGWQPASELQYYQQWAITDPGDFGYFQIHCSLTNQCVDYSTDDCDRIDGPVHLTPQSGSLKQRWIFQPVGHTD